MISSISTLLITMTLIVSAMLHPLGGVESFALHEIL